MANQSGGRIGAAILIAGLFLGGSVWVFGHTPVPVMRTSRLAVALPPGDSLGGPVGWYPDIAISPDGARIAYAATHDGVTQLYLKDDAEWSGHPIAGTGDAHTPFFSPDGQWLGAVVADQIVKFPLAGGRAVALSNVPYKVYGACWASDGWIYMGAGPPLALRKISVAGGLSMGATEVDDDHGETDHRYPEVLPGGKFVLVAARDAGHTFDEAKIDAFSLKTGKRTHLLTGGTNPRYLASGHLVFLHAGKLMAVPFDPVNLQVKGTPVTVLEGVAENPVVGAGQYAVSASGTLVYFQGESNFPQRELVFVDHSGATRVLSAKKAPYEDLAISADGRQLAFTAGEKTTDVWIHDMASGAEKQFTTGGDHKSPAWSADGKALIYSGYQGVEDAEWMIVEKELEGSPREIKMYVSETPVVPWSTSHDGKILFFQGEERTGRHTFQMMTLDGSHNSKSLSPRDFDHDWSQLSPDGHWLAFNDDSSGQQEVYVESFPQLMSPVKVSSGGGMHPQWSPDGKELYYRTIPHPDAPRPLAKRTALLAIPVETAPAFHAGTPRVLFEGPFVQGGHDYAVTPDGKGFIFIRENEPSTQSSDLRVIVNWTSELARRLPAK